MAYRIVDVIQPHTLGAGEAMKRIQKMLNDQGGGNANPHIVPVGQQILDVTARTITINLLVWGTPVHAVITCADKYVEVKTDEVKGQWPFVEIGESVANNKIKAMLSDCLK